MLESPLNSDLTHSESYFYLRQFEHQTPLTPYLQLFRKQTSNALHSSVIHPFLVFLSLNHRLEWLGAVVVVVRGLKGGVS